MRIISIGRAIRAEAERVAKVANGNDISDWLWDVAENAQTDWTDEYGCVDWDEVLDEIHDHADQYIDFIREHYPEDYTGE